MDREKARVLIREAQAGDKEALEKLTLANINMIHKIANKFHHTGNEPDDMFQLASIGFIRAVQQFDLSCETQLSTYAYPLIHNEIYKFLRNDGMIRTPRPVQHTEKLIFRHHCENKTVEEIAKIIEVDDLKLIEETLAHIHRGRVTSLNKTKYDKDDGSEEITLGDTIVGEESNFWDDNLILKDALSILDEREQYIMDLRYNKDMAQHEVADVIGVSQVQISRIERRIFVKIREYLGLPTEIPKVENKKPKSTTPKRPSGPQGDRDKAIQLLKTSTLNYPDIADITGVPLGSLYKMGREHRPQVLRDMVKSRATNKKGELNVYEA